MSTLATSIPKRMHSDIIHSFWSMMHECESKADNDDDRVLKHLVEGWFRQWNTLNGSNMKPRWIIRREKASLEKLVEAVDKANGHV